MRVEIVRSAMRDRFQFAPTPRKGIFYVRQCAGIVREFVRLRLVEAQPVFANAVLCVPGFALRHPLREALHVAPIVRHEVFQFHLLEFAHAKGEIAGRDLVPERFADLSDPEGRFLARGLVDVLEVDEDALSGFGPQVRNRGTVLHRADERLHHQVEVARLGERAGHPAVGAFFERFQMVGAKSVLAVAAIDQLVVKNVDVPRRLPDVGMHDDRRVERHDIVPQGDDLAPPGVAHILFEQRAERTIVVEAADPAVDLAGLKDEATPLRQGGNFIHRCARPFFNHLVLFTASRRRSCAFRRRVRATRRPGRCAIAPLS